MAALSQIVTGRPVEPSMLRESEDEMTKTLLAVLLAGPPYVLFDNINSADSATLAAVDCQPGLHFLWSVAGFDQAHRRFRPWPAGWPLATTPKSRANSPAGPW